MKLEDIKIVDQNLMSNVTDYDDYSKIRYCNYRNGI